MTRVMPSEWRICTCGSFSDGTRIWNGDLTETAGSRALRVESLAPVQHSTPSTTSKLFDGPAKRSLRRHEAIRPFPHDRFSRSALRRSNSTTAEVIA